MNKSFTNIKDQQVIQGNIFAPFCRNIHIDLRNYNQYRSASFKLSNVLSGSQYNQIEISFGGEIKAGELGL